jgi:serine/threonine protein kinase
VTIATPTKQPHECITEEELLELVSGACDRERAFQVLAEVERCADCHVLMLEAVRALAEQSRGANLWNSPTEAAHWELGTLIAHRYRIVRRLGSGGMGDVYEALDTDLTQRVALKTIAASFSRHETSLSRLKQEVRLARRVVHPNVCRVLEFGRHRDASGERYFLTMELLDGELLSAVLRREGSMTPQGVREIVQQVAEGLRAIHAQNIVHRDVKSSNILLTAGSDGLQAGGSRRAVLLDFGIARSLDAQSLPLTTHGLVGTPDYMAPEQMRGEAVSPATDVYALGLVMLELLCGRLPREAAPERAPGATQLRSIEPVSLPAELPGVPAELVAVVRWCLAPEPAARPAMEVLLQALKKVALESRPAPTLRPERARKEAISRLTVVAFSALALSLATAVIASVRSEPEATPGAASASRAAALGATHAVVQTQSQPTLATAPSSGTRAAALADVSAADDERASKPSAEAAPRLRRSASDAERLRCSPPYYYDEQGLRIYRKECL